jgi:hypothetical protein
MFLTSEGALLAIGLVALVCGMLGTWAVLRWTASGVKDPKPMTRGAGNVRRAIGPVGGAPKVK